MHIELEYSELEESFRTRLLYAQADQVEERQAQYQDACQIRQRWQALSDEADSVDLNLEDIKAEFSETTKKQVSDFSKVAAEFLDKLKTRGPGLPSVGLDQGLQLLHDFQVELEQLVAEREELVLAEKLFGMHITSYPEVAQVESELKKLAEVYAIYHEYIDAVKGFSSILWSELDVSKLVSGTEEIYTKLKKLKHLKHLPVFELADRTIEGFLNSLPLMADLKSDALRKRHWDQLMRVTGQQFDMDPKTFTLANMFAMQLHNFREEISGITSAAVKELTIEQELQKVAAVWREQKFDLFKYTKGGEDRGWLLRSTEDVMVLLEDMSLNLQSMMASRFVKPFLEDVRRWEQRLSLIGETIEAWMLVQRKWMYLESIFVGSDDIRHQLPQEAKRFDNIDKTWKKIMADTAKNTNVLEACSADGRLQTLLQLSEELETCQKSLSEYLDTKRCSFPRFFFISDDELLSILGTSDPTSVQEHMLKLFDNCAQLKLGRGNKTVIGMVSSEGETFDFRNVVNIEGAVETWMTNVEVRLLVWWILRSSPPSRGARRCLRCGSASACSSLAPCFAG